MHATFNVVEMSTEDEIALRLDRLQHDFMPIQKACQERVPFEDYDACMAELAAQAHWFYGLAKRMASMVPPAMRPAFPFDLGPARLRPDMNKRVLAVKKAVQRKKRTGTTVRVRPVNVEHIQALSEQVVHVKMCDCQVCRDLVEVMPQA